MATPTGPVRPQGDGWYIAGAVLTGLVGTHSALCLAAAALRLQQPKLMFLTGLMFSVQCVFCLHCIGMCGLDPGVPWGYDVGLAVASFVTVAIFGTAAITFTLRIRSDVDLKVRGLLPPAANRPPHFPSFLLQSRIVLAHVVYPRLILLAAVLMVGVAGCHHLGMWSMRGMGSTLLATRVTLPSLAFTGVICSVVCALIILTFFLVPEGVLAGLASAALCGGLTLFHFSSAAWGMDYVVGVEGISTHSIVSSDSLVFIVILQGAVSQIITTVFSAMAIDNYDAVEREIAVAQTLCVHLQDMDLQGAREVESTLQRASTLTDLLSQIVRNLEMLKPHAPEAVYVAAECKQEEDNLEHSESSVRASRTASSISMWDWQRASDRYSDHTDGRSPRRSIATVHQAEVRSTGKVVAAKNPTLGLVPMFLSVLRIRLMELDTVLGTDLDKDAVECALLEFMEVITAEATTHHGTILSCSNGVAIVMWQTRSPDPALECATAIQHNSKLSVVQVVQCGRFLCGNLATDLTHSFNVLGSFDFYSQQLLRVAGNRCHVLITTPEWERVGLKRRCLPLERVLLGTQLSAPAATSSPSTPVAAAVPATPTAAAAAPVPVNYLREAAAGAKALRAPCDVSSLLTVLLQAHIPGLHHAKLSKKLTFAVGYLSKPYLEQGKAVKEQQFTLHDVPVKVVPRAMPEGGNMMICFFAQKVIRNYVTKEFARLGVVTAGCNPYTLFLHFDTVENMEKAVQLRFITLLGAKVRLLPCKVGGALIEK